TLWLLLLCLRCSTSVLALLTLLSCSSFPPFLGFHLSRALWPVLRCPLPSMLCSAWTGLLTSGRPSSDTNIGSIGHSMPGRSSPTRLIPFVVRVNPPPGEIIVPGDIARVNPPSGQIIGPGHSKSPPFLTFFPC
ncbi:hypothetical protein C8R47DRAFT_1162327, partial [Mycena vitilis]